MSFFQNTDWSINYRILTFKKILDLIKENRAQIEYAKKHEWLNDDEKIEKVLDSFSKHFHHDILFAYHETNGKIILYLDTDHHIMLSFIQGIHSFKGTKFNDLEYYSKNRILEGIEIKIALYSPNSIMDHDLINKFI